MKALEPPDCHHLSAALGWFELANWQEANEELEKIAPTLRAHPDVLEVRCAIYAKLERWETVLDIAKAISQLDPDRTFGPIYLACAFHKLKRTEEARLVLVKILNRFPTDWLVRFNLACYECQLGNQAVAWAYLAEAFELGDAKAVKLLALNAYDLEPFWKQIGDMKP